MLTLRQRKLEQVKDLTTAVRCSLASLGEPDAGLMWPKLYVGHRLGTSCQLWSLVNEGLAVPSAFLSPVRMQSTAGLHTQQPL